MRAMCHHGNSCIILQIFTDGMQTRIHMLSAHVCVGECGHAFVLCPCLATVSHTDTAKTIMNQGEKDSLSMSLVENAVIDRCGWKVTLKSH